MNRTLLGIGDKMTIEICQLYNALGLNCIWNDGKDLTLIDKEKDLPNSHLERSKKHNTSTKSITKNTSADKTNYSVVCRRCGRKLSSEVSRNRGYGSYCYRKVASDLKRDDNKVEEINFIDEIKGVM